MRTIVSVITVSGLIAACWGTVLTTDAQSARQPNPAPKTPAPAPREVVETDAARRARLEARIADWARSDRKPSQAEARATASTAQPVSRPTRRQPSPEAKPAEAPSSARPVPTRPVTPETAYVGTSTIAPPPTTSAFVRTAGARGYRAPRLDLVNSPRIPTDPIECLTQAIYYEARNESEEGQAAVAEVVINRSRAGNYPRDICQVVYQRNSRTCQFTFTCDGSIGRGAISMGAWARAERIAREVHSGRSALLPKSSVNYHANYVRPSWGRRLEKVRQIGAHIFYGRALNGSTPGAATVTAEPPSTGGLTFTRVAALDQAYAALMGSAKSEDAPTR